MYHPSTCTPARAKKSKTQRSAKKAKTQKIATNLPSAPAIPSPDELANAPHTARQLRQWGVPWPPSKDWRRALQEKWHALHPENPLPEEIAPAIPSPEEISNSRFTAAQLALWGVPWPPPKGWRRDLAKKWHALHPPKTLSPEIPSPEEISNSRFTAAQLALWGVPWPPPKGWRRELEERWRTLNA